MNGSRTESYTYDLNGNRTGTGYSTTVMNETLTSPGLITYVYDKSGNTISANSGGTFTTNTYDYRNRLTEVTQGGTLVATYVYNALDQRIGIQESGARTWTVYNGPSADALPYADFNGSGTMLTRYAFGPGVVNGAVVDELLARTSSGGATAWYLTDKLDSVRDVVSSSGSVLDHVVFDSFGKIVTETNASNGDRFKFATGEYDPVTGLYYYRARYYEQTTGRFISEDPREFDAGDSNLYRYTLNDPARNTDPTGEVVAQVGGTAIGAIGGSIYGYWATGTWSGAVQGGLSGAAVGLGFTTGNGALVGAGMGGLFSIYQNGGSWSSWLIGSISGAVGGAVSSTVGCSMGMAYSGAIAGLGSGVAGGVAGDATGQLISMALGYQSQYNWSQTAAAGAMGGAMGLALGALWSWACFGAGTPLLTPEGDKAIEQIRPGDFVLAAPEHDPEAIPQPRRVEAVFRNRATILELRVSGQTIRTTAEHPFWVWGHGWTVARKLVVGDHLLSHNQRSVVIEAIVDEPDVAEVFNVRVQEFHTYFVGHTAWGFSIWAHNACVSATARGSTTGPPKFSKDPQRFSANNPLKAIDWLKQQRGDMNGVIATEGEAEAETMANAVARQLGLTGNPFSEVPQNPNFWPHFHLPLEPGLPPGAEHWHFWWPR